LFHAKGNGPTAERDKTMSVTIEANISEADLREIVDGFLKEEYSGSGYTPDLQSAEEKGAITFAPGETFETKVTFARASNSIYRLLDMVLYSTQEATISRKFNLTGYIR